MTELELCRADGRLDWALDYAREALTVLTRAKGAKHPQAQRLAAAVLQMAALQRELRDEVAEDRRGK